MELVDLYINDRDYAKSMRAIFEFMNNVTVMKVDPYATDGITTYLSKRSMHGVPNIWPLNTIKYVDKKNPSDNWTIENMYDSIIKDRNAYAFITAFGCLINSTEVVTKINLSIAKTEVNIYSCNGWWEDHATLGLQDHLRDIARNKELLLMARKTVQNHREECNHILAKVFSEAVQVKVSDGDGDSFIPDKLSISSIMKREPK